MGPSSELRYGVKMKDCSCIISSFLSFSCRPLPNEQPAFDEGPKKYRLSCLGVGVGDIFDIAAL